MLDANVILRYILNDNEDMVLEVTEVIKSKNVIVTIEVIAEVIYVLKRIYGVDTICFHINCWTDKMFADLERFFANNKVEIVTFSVAKDIRGSFWLNKLVFVKVKVRRVLSFIKHKIFRR